MRLTSFAVIAAIAVLSISACGDDAPDSTNGAQLLVLRRGLGGQPGSLDPHRAEDAFSYDVLRDLYEGLTASSPTGEVVPAAAESWRVTDGGKTYIFAIRSDARWSNGDPVTASNFVSAFRRAMDPATASGAADLLRAIVNAPAVLDGSLPPDQLGVRALDERNLEIALSRPVPYFPDILTNTVASPIHPSSLAATADLSRPGSAITNGPFMLGELTPGANLRLVRNPHYTSSGMIAFDEIHYEFVPDENAEFTRFRAGELDVTNSVPEQRYEKLARDPDSGLQHRATLATFYFSFNTDRGPLSRNRALREALSLAVDRDAITRSVTRAGQVPAYSMVPEGVWNYKPARYEWETASVERRVARARGLYAAAGYSTRNPLKVRLLYNENELVQKVCIAIASMWKETLGVDVELVQMEFKAYLSARADPAQWDVVRVGWTADYNDASTFLDTMTKGSPQNFGRWTDEHYAALLNAAASETDAGKRRETLQEAEFLMLQQYPVLPVYFYVTRRLVQPRIEAPPINPMNRTYSRYFRVAD
jgi:ABC-type oligopeptide transport system substrate-binding subunit